MQEEVSSIEEKKVDFHQAMETMTEEEYNDLEKEYLEEKETEKRKAEEIEAEIKRAEKTIRYIVNRRIRKGCRPLKAIEELLSLWIEECDIMERPTIVNLSKREVLDHSHTDVIPELSYYDKTFYASQAMKWKTKKEKYLGEFRESPVDIETDKVKKCKYYRKLSITGLWDEGKLTTLCNAGDSGNEHSNNFT